MDKDIYDLIYENKTAGRGEPQQFEMEFLKFDAAAISRNFKNSTFKGEDFFVHFEEIFYFDAQKSLDAGSACEANGVNLSSAGEAINNGEAINLDATRGKNLTERASVNEISSDCGKISATAAGDKISACANATQILKKASAVPCKKGSQAERQSKPSFTKQQDKHQSNLEGCAETRAEHQSELDCAKSQLKQQSKPCTAEPQDVLILLSLGAFDFPQQCFIRVNASGTRYFICRPLPTRENHAAHQKISEIFSQWQR